MPKCGREADHGLYRAECNLVLTVLLVFLQGKLVLWRCVFVTHLLVVLVLGGFYWGQVEGLSIALRRAEAFNILVFAEIGYCVTTRFIKASTFHPRALVSAERCGIQQLLAGVPVRSRAPPAGGTPIAGRG